MTGLLEGKSALVTGGGGGIGRATALAFAREGARVAVSDYVEETAQQTVALINGAGGQAMSVNADVTDAGQVAATQKRLTARIFRKELKGAVRVLPFPLRLSISIKLGIVDIRGTNAAARHLHA